jgi:hypothetical protein
MPVASIAEMCGSVPNREHDESGFDRTTLLDPPIVAAGRLVVVDPLLIDRELVVAEDLRGDPANSRRHSTRNLPPSGLLL